MINSLCGSMRSLNSEIAGIIKSEASKNKTAEANNPWIKQETTSTNQKINGSTTNLNIPSPAVKYELDGDIEIQSPDYSLLKSIFSDDQTLQGDFMVYSPPRIFSPLNQRSSKGPSPLHRVFNSPNIQYMSVDNLSLPPLENIPPDKEDDAFMVFSPMKITGGDGESSSSVMQENDIYGLGFSVPAPLSQQLHHEWQQEHKQGYLQHQQAQPLQLRCLLEHQSQSQNMQNSSLMVPVPTGSEEVYDSGLHLVHLLLVSAEAVSKEDYMLARRNLHYLNRLVSPLGDSMQRVAACFTEALSARLAAILTNKPSASIIRNPSFNTFPDPKSPEILKIYQILYQACPYIKFAHFTANQAIFEAFESQMHVHVIDLDILQGYQWPAFMQALAARPGGAPFLRITGVGPSLEDVRETGRALTELAHSLHVPFEFHPIGGQLEDLKPQMFIRKVGEALAVNSVSRLHSVPRDRLGNLLTMIRNLAPNIVTIVEQESSHNGPYFLGRFLEALHYYSAIFDSLDATFTPDSAQRDKVEQHIFAPEIRNIIASEGQDRVIRHERVEKWRRHMEGRGFKAVPLSPNAVTQSKILLSLYSCEGYKLSQDRGCLLLGWQERAIIAASSWTC